VFYILGVSGLHEGVVYFLWLGIFNLIVVAQFWAFANDLYSPAQGKRLFPLVGLGGSLGAWIGALLASWLIHHLGPFPLLLIAAAMLVSCVMIARYLHRRSVREQSQDGATAEKPLGKEGGFALIFKDRYLLMIAVLTVLLNIVNTSGEFLLSKIVVQQAETAFPGGHEMFAAREKLVGEFYGNYFGWTNLIGLLLQTFATSRIFAAIGVGGALLIGPGIALFGYTMMLLHPALGVIRVVKILDNSNDYSVQKTATQALYLPTSREAKYKAKAAIDTFFVRMGDVTQAGIVYLGTILSVGLPVFAAVNLALTGLWLMSAIKLRRELHRKGVE
jgi:AAA family ATP:ADP antiporter